MVAYGALLPQSALDIPEHGWVNLHFSVLPAWRGAAPVQHALWAGDEITGATTFRIVKALDAGPTYGVMTERVRPTDTAGDLLARLAEGGAGLLVSTLDGIADGSLEARPQPEDGVSFAPKILVDDARIDWTEPAVRVDRRIRACTPGPGAWTTLDGERVKVGAVRIDPDHEPLEPGLVAVSKNAVHVGTATAPVRLGEVKAFGKKQMDAADWARGVRLPGRHPLRGGTGVVKATPEDVDAICLSLPEVELGISWGDRPTYKVPKGDKGKGFLLYRMPHKTAVDPETGEMYDDLLVIVTPTEHEKRLLVEDDASPFFTIDHFRSYNAVLVQQSRLGEIERDELADIITDAWAARAPKRLVEGVLRPARRPA